MKIEVAVKDRLKHLSTAETELCISMIVFPSMHIASSFRNQTDW